MSEQPAASREKGGGNLMRARLNRFRSSRQQGILGAAELIGLAGSLIILLLVIFSYLYFLLPARSQRDNLVAERSRLQSQLRSLKDVVRQEQSTDAAVQNITQSLEAFEKDRLVGASDGRMSLYDSLNQLMRKNDLRNTSGPTYTPLDPKGLKAGGHVSRAANTKWQTIYPGIAISVTVEGQYQSLRRFVRDLETDRKFVIINSVELERATETDGAPPVEGGPAGGTRGAMVSLRLDLATYFQRDSSRIPVESVTQ